MSATMDCILPLLGTLGIGGVLGFCTAMFIKQTARMVGCGLGLLFVLMQVLAYYGIAQWHWDALAARGAPLAAGAGHLLWAVLCYNLPFTGGFGTGFWLGIRR